MNSLRAIHYYYINSSVNQSSGLTGIPLQKGHCNNATGIILTFTMHQWIETEPIINLDTFARSTSRRFLFQQSYFLYEQCLLHNSILLFISKVGGLPASPSARALISSSDSPEHHLFFSSLRNKQLGCEWMVYCSYLPNMLSATWL